MKSKKIAKICHNVHNVICEQNGLKVTPWEEKSEEHQAIVIDSVDKILSGEINSPEQAHDNFIGMKIEEGWIFGANHSEKKKTSPRLCEFTDLPDLEQMKDEYFFNVACSFRKYD